MCTELIIFIIFSVHVHVGLINISSHVTVEILSCAASRSNTAHFCCKPKMRFLAALVFLCVASASLAIPAIQFKKILNAAKDDGGEIYVLLVAGSNTWMNYRHQVRPSTRTRILATVLHV